jgi:tetratricopeptide (TPR) repeat protein
MRGLGQLQRKDYVTIAISSLALLVSLSSTVLSYWRGYYDEQRTVRSQLSDVLSRIITTNVESAKLFRDVSDEDPTYVQAISAALSQQQGFLLHQAMYLTDQIPRLVSAFEYNTIAYSNANSGDPINAERYYRTAIEVSSNDNYRAQAMRSYAYHLFSQRRFEEGRDELKRAITLISGGDNFARFTRGFLYQSWAANESAFANAPKRAEELFESARNEYAGIDVVPMRDAALKTLSQVRSAPPAAAARQGAGVGGR